ncbi:pre-rRNA-processing protein IPI3 [Schizopora paradoxa]|uniref:Pre-rRNA-processing protein IPI3 n=1 Tax=Schizopora paradoxa TaxID=27342 RepID=A0A0H2SLN4_9AGAM|nr:pre-rRNA-processing protein IPI3 [Schizopora paradoxa]
MSLQEALLCATGPTSSNAGPGSVAFHDLQTGSLLANFKQTNASANCTAVLKTKNGQGGFVLAAQPDKPVLNAYVFQKDQIALKMVLPEKLSCIAVDNDGDYCAGGTALGRIFLWEAGSNLRLIMSIASGILFNVWDAHYQRISVLRFTQDGAGLISGADDSGLSVWSISRLLSNGMQGELPTPYCSLSDHTLPITDVACGVGVFPSCRVLSTSLDHSVKLWDISSRTLLTTFMFPNPIIRLAFESTERTFFAASSDDAGTIHQVKLYRRREADGRRAGGFEAVGGGGVDEAIRLDANAERTITVGQPVSAMAISLNASSLIVGTENGLVNVYDIASHQLLKSISSHKGLAITYLVPMLRPPDLIGHTSISLSTSNITTKESLPLKPIAPFQRIRDPKAREAHEVPMILPLSTEDHYDPTFYSESELLQDHATFVQPPFLKSGTTSVASQSRITELEAEVLRLQEQLGKAKSINDTMWEKIVQRAVASAKEKTEGAPAATSV